MHVKILQKNQLRVSFFYLCITQLRKNSKIASIDTLSCLGGIEVAHQLAKLDVSGSISDCGNNFMFALLFCFCSVHLEMLICLVNLTYCQMCDR